MAPREVDPLLIKQGSSTVSSDHDHHASHSHGIGRLIQSLTGFLVVCAIVLGLVVMRDQKTGAIVGGGEVDQDHAALDRGVVTMTKDGDYKVHYSLDTTESTTTFGDLAAIMIPPWYEASLLAISDVLIKETMDPADPHLKFARKVLLRTRDLLDVFSPVYPPAGRRQGLSWKKIREFFKVGYERVGYYHDLESSGVAYNADLWQQRRDDVLDWKDDFVAYRKQHNVRAYLIQAITTDGCYDHKESHLFWGELGVLQNRGRSLKKHKGDPPPSPSTPSSQWTLPCASDLATPSLARLAQVQLTNALDYLRLVLPYKTVLTVHQQEEYHNLRKELRTFSDEYGLFGSFLLVPSSTDKTTKDRLNILDSAVKRIGVFHDQWNAYQLYQKENKHPEEQKELAVKIDQGWDDFKEWATETSSSSMPSSSSSHSSATDVAVEEGRLGGAIQGILDTLTAEMKKSR